MMSHLRLLGIDHHHPSSYWSRLVSPIPTHNKNLASSSFSFSFSNSLFLISSRPALLPSSPPNPISISFRIPSLSALPLQFQQELVDSPVSVDLIPICSDAQFHQLIAQTQHPLIIVWMANWCRNCIYLKPKLEKLAAEYYPRLRFYGVDVNAVSHKLVAHAGVTKMPTIQLWKDGKKQAEVIGGRKAYWVIGDVQEMIENECTT